MKGIYQINSYFQIHELFQEPKNEGILKKKEYGGW